MEKIYKSKVGFLYKGLIVILVAAFVASIYIGNKYSWVVLFDTFLSVWAFGSWRICFGILTI